MKDWLFIPSFVYLLFVFYLFYSLIQTPDKQEYETYIATEREAASLSTRNFRPQHPLQLTQRTPEMRSRTPPGVDLRLHVGKKTIQIVVNGDEVLAKDMTYAYRNKSDPGKYAGLYMVVLQEFSGKPMKIEKYLTMQIGGDFDLLKMLMEIQPGRIIILASLYESFQLISNIFLNYLVREGALAIKDIKMGERWAMAWTKGGRIWWEEKVNCKTEPRGFWQGGNIDVAVEIPKSIETMCDTWPSTDQYWIKRKRFCRKYEGYGNLCSCEKPLKLGSIVKKEFQPLEDSFLLIISSPRPFTLSRCLKRLSKIVGFNPFKTVVSANGLSQEVAELTAIFGLKHLSHESNLSDLTKRITDHYFFSLNQSFALFPKANKAIVLEEDLFVAPDFFSYFSQLASILEADPTLYCVSAWNDFGYSQTASNPRAVQRTDTMPGLGWMLTRTIFEELKPKWPKSDRNKTDWDMWMRFYSQTKKRHCLIPEVSRTFHFGREGVHTSSQTQRLYYDDRKITEEEDIVLEDLDRLNKSLYEEDLIRSINSSIHLDSSIQNPCEDDFILKYQNRSYVIWFKMINLDDTFTWEVILLCLGMWSPDIRGGYNKVWKLRFLGTQLYIIGWPLSPYSFLKPKETNVMRRSAGQKNETEPPVIIEKVL